MTSFSKFTCRWLGSFKGATFWLSFPGFLSIPITLLSVPVLLQKITFEELGLLLICNVALNLSVVLLLGSDRNLLRLLPVSRHSLDLKSIYKTSLLLPFCLITLLCLITTYALPLITRSPEVNGTTIVLLWSGCLLNVTWCVQRSILLANDNFKGVSIGNLFFYASFYVVAILGLAANNDHFNLNHQLTLILTTKLSLVLYFYLSIRIWWQEQTNATYEQLLFKTLFAYGKWIGLHHFLQILNDGIDRVIVGHFLGSGEAAEYAIPTSVSQKLTIVPTAFGLSRYSRLARDLDLGLTPEVLVNTIFLAGVSMLFIICSEYLFTFWLNDRITENILTISKVSAVSYAVFGINNILNSLIETKGLSKQIALSDMIITTFGIAAYSVSVNAFGLIGIAISFASHEFIRLYCRMYFLNFSKPFKLAMTSIMAMPCALVIFQFAD